MHRNQKILLAVVPLAIVILLCIMTAVGTYLWAFRLEELSQHFFYSLTSTNYTI